ncbi:hypothetical protein VNO78_27120 [Psophocarpus tetragonolobus]|uniref:Uncharacterized protein n=1 Tax=Psophocarpus tetragonolobus TaxID=3891 RepID=A0AAN9S2X3_PSOTE
MANSTIKVLNIVLFLALISKGYSTCSLEDISLTQTKTGVTIQGKPEWSVTITNKCPCAQKNIVLDCQGFQTVERIDPSLLDVDAKSGACVVKPNQLIYKDPVTFKYAWDNSFPLTPTFSQRFC